MRSRATLAAGALVAAVAGVATVRADDAALVPVAGAARPDGARASEPDLPPAVRAEYGEEHPDVPAATLDERLALMPARTALLGQWGTLHEKTFAGSWYDFDNGVWHLLSTDPAVLEVMAAQARAAGVRVEPRVVPYSMAELEARATLIRSGKDPISEISTSVGVDVLANKVKVVVSPPPSDVHDPMVMFVEFE